MSNENNAVTRTTLTEDNGTDKKLLRAQMTFFPALKRPTEAYEDEGKTEFLAPHPLYLFEYLQDENPWVDLAVRVVSTACASTNPLMVVTTNNKKKKKMAEEFQRKFERPNPFQTGKDFFLKTYSDLYSLGNCYWHVIKNRKGGLHSIHVLPAKDMRVSYDYDKDNNIVITYRNSQRSKSFSEKEIVHFKLPNPKSVIYGRPVFYSNILGILTDEEVNKWVQSFFAQAFSGGAIFKQAADELVANRNRQWLSEEYTKPENAGKPMLLEGEIELIDNGSKFRDFDYGAMKNISREEILQHAGVPLSQAGIRSDSGQANIEVINTEEEAFVRNTVKLILDIVFEKINVDFFGTIFEDFDLKAKYGLLERFNNQNSIRFADSAAKFGITLNEYRQMMNLPPVPDEFGGNMWMTATNNGVVPTKYIIGIDPNTGEKSPTILDGALMGGEGGGENFTNLASVASNPSGRGDVGKQKAKPKEKKAKEVKKP